MGGYRFRRGSTRGLAGAEQRSLARNQGTKLAAAAAQRFSHVLGEACKVVRCKPLSLNLDL